MEVLENQYLPSIQKVINNKNQLMIRGIYFPKLLEIAQDIICHHMATEIERLTIFCPPLDKGGFLSVIDYKKELEYAIMQFQNEKRKVFDYFVFEDSWDHIREYYDSTEEWQEAIRNDFFGGIFRNQKVPKTCRKNSFWIGVIPGGTYDKYCWERNIADECNIILKKGLI